MGFSPAPNIFSFNFLKIISKKMCDPVYTFKTLKKMAFEFYHPPLLLYKENEFFPLIPISLQPNAVDLRCFKL